MQREPLALALAPEPRALERQVPPERPAQRVVKQAHLDFHQQAFPALRPQAQAELAQAQRLVQAQ